MRFAQHIKPLFRPMDRQSMKWAFDLWLYKDVKEHADGILQRLRNGSMPCDGAWSHGRVETFQRWVESGPAHGLHGRGLERRLAAAQDQAPADHRRDQQADEHDDHPTEVQHSRDRRRHPGGTASPRAGGPPHPSGRGLGTVRAS